MKQNEKARKMMNGRFIFPSTWVELNPEKAEASTKVVFLVEDGKCGVYYSVTEACMLSEAEEKQVRKSGRNMGFSNRANIFGFAENVKNVGNARFIKMEE